MEIIAHGNFRALSGCIRRDPLSWKGFALLYIQPASAEAFEARVKKEYGAKDILAMRDGAGAYVLMGALPADTPPASGAEIVLRAADISTHWRSICALLDGESPAKEEPATQAQGKTLSILIVEDDRVTSQLLAKHLGQYGEITMTGNYRQAMANYAVTKPDLIFLDIHYTDDQHDGFDVMANIAGMDSEAFVVMFSGDSDPATVFKCLSLGAQGFIAKPFKPSDFTSYLDKFARLRPSVKS